MPINVRARAVSEQLPPSADASAASAAPARPRVERSARLPRLFLWLVAIAIVLVIAAGLAWRLAGTRLLMAALTPHAPFDAGAAGPPFDYGRAQSWAAGPQLADDPTRFRPEGAAAATPAGVAVFFVPPTAAFATDRWNERSDSLMVADRLAGFLRIEASALAAAGPVWAPHYRQAVLGSFLATTPDDLARAEQARDLAYQDVRAAFAAFIAKQDARAPIVLAGHSQGTVHLMRLMREEFLGQPIAARVAAVYAIGWPISISADLPAMGLPACTRPGQPRCIMAWQSFAEPADPSSIVGVYDAGVGGGLGLTGRRRAGTPMLCSNPLTGGADGPAGANPGSLVPSATLKAGRLVAPGVPARCNAQGFLLIGEAPGGYPAYVMPGNNYHVFDYPLFWQAVRADVQARIAGWRAEQ